MTAKPRLASGKKVVRVLAEFGYRKISQRGSHIKLRNDAAEITLIVPDHKEVDRWTLKTILKQADIPEEEFNKHLTKS